MSPVVKAAVVIRVASMRPTIDEAGLHAAAGDVAQAHAEHVAGCGGRRVTTLATLTAKSASRTTMIVFIGMPNSASM